MAKTCLVQKQKREPKFGVQKYNRCQKCGRARGYIRKYHVCRICFRELANRGIIPGVVRSSW